MKISYNWLQTYFDKKLPAPKELAELFTMYAFEVESVEEYADGEKSDHIFDVKILPNRAHDCLSHRGVAREVGTLLGRKIKEDAYIEDVGSVQLQSGLDQFSNSGLTIQRNDTTLCTRYSAAIIRGVKVGPSPTWLVERLQSLGQKSINNVVDATNFVMFSLGQPLHAFGLGKLIEKSGYSILVRNAKEGETITALDGKTYTLSPDMLMITDANCKDNKALGIAGVKGGTAAEIDASTTAILLESANFDPISVRMTAKKLGLRTDASQRFENGLTPELTMEALQMVCGLIVQIAGGEGGATIDAVVDDRNPAFAQTIISLKYSDVENLLGFAIPHKKIVQILHQLGCGVQEGQPHGASGDAQIIVTVPYERLDLTIKEDIIEEIGRVYGFFNVPPLQPKNSTGRIDEVHVPLQTIAADIIRAVLTERGFNEVYTYTFRNNGERELQNPIASDKKYLRTDLASGLSESLTLNMYNAPLLQIHDFVKIFEIGNVFKDDKETLSLALAIAPVKKIKNSDQLIADMFTDVRAVFEKMFNVSLVAPKATVWEIAIEDIVSSAAQLPHTFTYPIDNTIKYKKISPYPFMLRDIAVFVPEGIVSDAVFEIVKREVGELLVSSALFDVFTKKSEDGSAKTSYAYSLVFQSNERTLSDDEINVVMERVTKALNEQDGWQVR